MSFTPQERHQIRLYLGWSEQFRDYDTRLETQMDQLGGQVDQSAATTVRTLLAALSSVDTLITNALGNLTLKKAEGVEFAGMGEIEGYRNHGRNLVRRVAIIFDVEPKRDYYGEDGDGAGGVIPLG